ncbi:unnamed protein product [Linum trigynum]|uniref:Uncharacterized protein n=1 Tax=Linum trigynum TaxID=586398 RepID=A0AAV2G647_9ROSI
MEVSLWMHLVMPAWSYTLTTYIDSGHLWCMRVLLMVQNGGDHDATERCIFAGMVADVYRQGPAAVRKASQLLLPHIRPQVAGLLEPRESEAPKGRPPKRSNTRDPSWFEHERARSAKRSKTNQNTKRHRRRLLQEVSRKVSICKSTMREMCVPIFATSHLVCALFLELMGVTPIPPFSPQWSHFRDMLRVADWDSLYEAERQLYIDLGGHHPTNDDESD